jgi:LEA14-like dessication related protein
MPALLIVALLLLYSAGRQAKQAVNYFEYNPVRFRLGSLGIFSTNITYVFTIKNPTATSATVQTIYGKILAGGLQVGTFQVPQQFTIRPQGTEEISANVTLSNFDFLKAIASVLTSGKIPQVQFVGDVNTTLLGSLPFSYVALVQKDFSLRKKA